MTFIKCPQAGSPRSGAAHVRIFRQPRLLRLLRLGSSGWQPRLCRLLQARHCLLECLDCRQRAQLAKGAGQGRT